MAKIGRALRDNHLFIMAGPHEGTWQITDEGAKEIRRIETSFRIPEEPGERVSVSGEIYHALKDHNHLRKLGWEYQPNTFVPSNMGINDGVKYLPLRLCISDSPRKYSLQVHIPKDQMLGSHATDVIKIDGESVMVTNLRRSDQFITILPRSSEYKIAIPQSAKYFDYATVIPGINGDSGEVFFTTKGSNRARCMRDFDLNIVQWKNHRIWWLLPPGKRSNWPGTMLRYSLPVQQGWQCIELLPPSNESQRETQDCELWLAQFQTRVVTSPSVQLELLTIPRKLRENGKCIYGVGQKMAARIVPIDDTEPTITGQICVFEVQPTRANQLSLIHAERFNIDKVKSKSKEYVVVTLPVELSEQSGQWRIQCYDEDEHAPKPIAQSLIVTVSDDTARRMPLWLRPMQLRVTHEKGRLFKAFNHYELPVGAEDLKDRDRWQWELFPEGLCPKCIVQTEKLADFKTPLLMNAWAEIVKRLIRQGASPVTLVIEGDGYGRITLVFKSAMNNVKTIYVK